MVIKGPGVEGLDILDEGAYFTLVPEADDRKASPLKNVFRQAGNPFGELEVVRRDGE